MATSSSQLNEIQRAAVSCTKGPLLVPARVHLEKLKELFGS